MSDVLTVMLYSSFAGITIFMGGIASMCFNKHMSEGFFKEKIVHTSVAFGGGIIVAAVAFVLVPEGMQGLHVLPMSLLFLAGAATFYYIDRWLEKRGGAVSQLLAMLMDFVPEAMALGAVFATDHKMGLLLALFIGLQNFPEAFNSYIDLRSMNISSKRSLTILFLLSFTGIIAALIGFYLLTDMPLTTSSLMLFSSGGILYLIFQDIAPMSKLENTSLPALGVNFGFLVGMIGQKLLG